MEVEVLMKRMVELQQQKEEEECTQEEMVTRFERQRSESIPTGTTIDTMASCLHIKNWLTTIWPAQMVYLYDCHIVEVTLWAIVIPLVADVG